MTPTAGPDREARSAVRSLSVYYLASFAALGAYLPYFPRWCEARGLRGAWMGATTALLPAMGVLAPPVIGVVADTLGERGSLLKIASLGAGAAMVALAISADHAPLALVFAGVAVYAVFRSPLVMLADVVALERAPAAGRTYGSIRAFGSVGFLLAALAVGHVVDPARGAALPLVIGALLLAAALPAATLPAKLPARARAHRALPLHDARVLLTTPRFATFLLVTALGNVAHASYDLCFSLHLRDLSASNGTAGLGWAIGVLAEVALLARADVILARFSAPVALALGLLGASLRWAILATVPAVPLLLALSPLHAISFALVWVASLAFVKESAHPETLATAQGLFTTAVAAGTAGGMIAWGALYRARGGPAVFGAATLVALAATAIAARWARRRRVGAQADVGVAV